MPHDDMKGGLVCGGTSPRVCVGGYQPQGLVWGGTSPRVWCRGVPARHANAPPPMVPPPP